MHKRKCKDIQKSCTAYKVRSMRVSKYSPLDFFLPKKRKSTWRMTFYPQINLLPTQSYTDTLSQTHSHTNTLTLTLSHNKHTHTLTLTLSPSLSRTNSLTRTHTLTHTDTRTLPHFHSHWHTHAHTFTLSLGILSTLFGVSTRGESAVVM